MEETLSKHKVALEALFVVERYVSALKNTKSSGYNEFSRADRETKDLLNQKRLPRDVRQAVDRVTSSILESYIASRELLEEENKRKDEQIRRRRTEYFIVVLYVLTIFAAFLVKDWKFVLACFPISFIEYRLLNDTLPFRVWERLWTKRKNDKFDSV